ncbi:MAG: DUF1679 domain-containing protein [Chloroflexota bacterium]|nr:DUF1679 domain-containing protein [Chloroflexota bacterium]
MASVAVPTGIQDVTAEWLTSALREGGLDVRVAALSAESIGEGAGVNGLTSRVRVEYESGSDDGPASFVLKLPPTHPASKEIGLRLGFYENEIRFYDELAENVSVNLPRHYYTGMNKERHDYALLLEDMAPAQPGDDIASCSWEAAAAIVDELPKLHVPWWNSELLPTLEWLPVGEPNIEAANQRFQETLFPATMNNYGDTISPTAYRVAEKYSRGLVHIVRQMTAAPYTLTHSDYRLVNMLLGGTDGELRVTVLDWQRVALGKGPIDVAFFCVLSLAPETRRAWQWELVERYHAGLVEQGVRDYSLEECRRDYRLCAFAPTRIALAHGSRPPEQLDGEAGRLLQATLMARAAAAMEDLDMEEFL